MTSQIDRIKLNIAQTTIKDLKQKLAEKDDEMIKFLIDVNEILESVQIENKIKELKNSIHSQQLTNPRIEGASGSPADRKTELDRTVFTKMNSSGSVPNQYEAILKEKIRELEEKEHNLLGLIPCPECQEMNKLKDLLREAERKSKEEEMKIYSEKEIEEIFNEGIEFDDLYDFLVKHKDLKMKINFDEPYFTIKLELVDL